MVLAWLKSKQRDLQALKGKTAIMADKIKKGSLVRAIREKLENSLEAKASDSRLPLYLFDTKGEVLEMKGDYALVKFGQVPTPNIWLRLDQLEGVGTAAVSDA